MSDEAKTYQADFVCIGKRYNAKTRALFLAWNRITGQTPVGVKEIGTRVESWTKDNTPASPGMIYTFDLVEGTDARRGVTFAGQWPDQRDIEVWEAQEETARQTHRAGRLEKQIAAKTYVKARILALVPTYVKLNRPERTAFILYVSELLEAEADAAMKKEFSEKRQQAEKNNRRLAAQINELQAKVRAMNEANEPKGQKENE